MKLSAAIRPSRPIRTPPDRVDVLRLCSPNEHEECDSPDEWRQFVYYLIVKRRPSRLIFGLFFLHLDLPIASM